MVGPGIHWNLKVLNQYKISEDISKWWDSKTVREAIDFFHESALLKNKNWESLWINAIKEEINK